MEHSETIIITGASGVIGKVLVKNFILKNYRVVGITSKKESCLNLLELYNEENKKGLFYCLDLDFMVDGWEKDFLKLLSEKQLSPDYLVCGARSVEFLKGDSEKIGQVSRSDFVGEFKLGVSAPYELIMSLACLEDSKLKSAVIISSMYGVVAPNLALYNDFIKESFISYGVVKSAQIHLAKELSVRLSSKNIRVNSVSFGGIEGRASDDFKKKYSQLSPSGRMLNEDDVFGPVEFLLSSNSSAVLGHNLNADGGWCIW